MKMIANLTTRRSASGRYQGRATIYKGTRRSQILYTRHAYTNRSRALDKAFCLALPILDPNGECAVKSITDVKWEGV